MIKWLHHLFNPHCHECDRCKSCENLKVQLEITIAEKQELLHTMLSIVKPNPVPVNFEKQDPVKTFISFSKARAKREAEDRMAARNMRNEEVRLKDTKQTIESLEKELGVVEDDNSRMDEAEAGNGNKRDGIASGQ